MVEGIISRVKNRDDDIFSERVAQMNIVDLYIYTQLVFLVALQRNDIGIPDKNASLILLWQPLHLI